MAQRTAAATGIPKGKAKVAHEEGEEKDWPGESEGGKQGGKQEGQEGEEGEEDVGGALALQSPIDHFYAKIIPLLKVPLSLLPICLFFICV